jgi:asparagine synthase (glutamine-hydrolysing)
MCGITGILNLTASSPIEETQLRQMLAIMRHRGPDQFGIYLDEHVGLGNARLSIIDLSCGQQPVSNEDETLWIVFNGEIFNYVELRPKLEARGHRFTTHTDTEVLLHLYEEMGPGCLAELNGQFAIAIWDAREKTLFLARDRLGVRPLFYTVTNGALIFGSEVKAILVDPRVRAEIDPLALDQIFTFWSTLSPRTIFRNILDVPPGHYLLARHGNITVRPYWRIAFSNEMGALSASRSCDEPPATELVRREVAEQELLEEFRNLLVDAVRIRLRADVPVGAYLSGGLDSATIAAIVHNYTSTRLETFSITFDDKQFDESEHQRRMACFLGTRHEVVHATHADIAGVFPEIVWHTETPIMRTAPAPMYLLSKRVRDRRFKVVLTGEGADEFVAGYDIFKEAKIRRFWSLQPGSKLRPMLLRRIYPDIVALSTSRIGYLSAFFGQGLTDTGAPDYSHAIRWRNNTRTKRFFSDDIRHTLAAEVRLSGQGPFYPPQFADWDSLAQAQYLEISTFLSQYLLSSQGDRVAMAHSVEGRFPFLDYRVVDFCCRLPAHFKLRGLTDKYLLRKVARDWLPEETWRRPKRAYRAPIHRSFFNVEAPDYVRELLSPGQIEAAGLFNPEAVAQLVNKLDRDLPVGETDDMALAGILSSQLVVRQFVANFEKPRPLSAADDVKVCFGHSNAQRGQS